MERLKTWVAASWAFSLGLFFVAFFSPTPWSFSQRVSSYISMVLLSVFFVITLVFLLRQIVGIGRLLLLLVSELPFFLLALFIVIATKSNAFPPHFYELSPPLVWLIFVQHIMVLVLFFVSLKFIREKNRSPQHKLLFDLFLFLIVLMPLFNYIFSNLDFFDFSGALRFLVFLSLPPLFLLGIARYLQVSFLPFDILSPILVALFYTYYSMPMLTGLFNLQAENHVVLYICSSLFFCCLLTFLYLRKPAVLKVFVGALLLSGCFSVLSESQNNASFVRVDGDTPRAASSSLEVKEAQTIQNRETFLIPEFKFTPDIFLLVYDSYIPPDLMNYYGIDNSDQYDYLLENGFQPYNSSYSLAADSLKSMSRVLDPIGEDFSSPRAIIAGNSLVNRELRANGYKTHYILSPYFLEGAPMLGDFSYPEMDRARSFGTRVMFRGIAQGEFKFDHIYSEIDWDEWVAVKRKVLQAQTETPKFLYAHSQLPNHSQNSGVCLPDETLRFAKRLKKANSEMRGDIEAVLASNREAIIIIAGDHGPALLGDCRTLNSYSPEQVTGAHLADRFGVFLSIRWPNENLMSPEEISVLQNTFLHVFSYLTQQNDFLLLRPKATSIRLSRAVPHGAIVNGKVTFGADQGQELYEAVREKALAKANSRSQSDERDAAMEQRQPELTPAQSVGQVSTRGGPE